MRFDLTDEQRAVRDAVTELCRARWDTAAVRRRVAGDEDGAATALWAELSRAGWTGAVVDERHGGQSLGIVELALVCEALGRAMAPAALLGHAAAAMVVAAAGDDEQRERVLPHLADGSHRAALAWNAGDEGAFAYDADGADVVVVVGPEGARLASAESVTMEPVDGMDLTRRLARVRVQRGEPLRGDTAVALDRVEVCVAAELVGIADRALEIAVAHARTREQFGRPIGAYQAVSHRCADMLLDVESARSAVLFAAWTADHDARNLRLAASVAKVAAAQGAWRVAASALQVHGGIGFTWEHDCHLLLRRAGASARVVGGVDEHLDRVAELQLDR